MLKIGLAAGFVIVLIGLGVVDAVVTVEDTFYAELLSKKEQVAMEEKEKDTEEEKKPEETGEEKEGVDIPTKPTPTPSGVRKQSGPNIEEILGAAGLEFQAITEPIFLSKIIPPEESAVTGAVLLKDKDRIGSIAWVESPKIKLYFIALKEALHSSFTPAIQDLVDETQHREGKPPRNLLTFLDTGINEERIVFVRVRDRLFEIHIAEGHDDTLFELIDQLTE